MNQSVAPRKVYDCFLYNGEIDVLEIRLHELASVVHRFVIVESDTTFSGLPKPVSFDPFDSRIAPFADRIRHVLVKDVPDIEGPWQREAWQRNAILRGVPDAARDDLVLISDVDEIPRAIAVKDIARDTANSVFGLQLAFYCFFVNYRNVEGPKSAITRAVAATRDELESVPPNYLRYAVRQGDVPARIVYDAGWHFSYLTDELAVRRKIVAFSRQEFNTDSFLSSIKILETARHRKDPFERPGFQWELIDLAELPAWLRANQRALWRLFFPRSIGERLLRYVVPGGSTRASRWRFAAPPVIICPHVHLREADEIRAKFGLDKPRGRRLEFFLWRDNNRIGPERAFEYCWERFPDRDIIILHSDMTPMPDDSANTWYEALIEYRNTLPQAGMIACNLFYPRATPDEQWRVQCAGGTFREGRIGHINGVVVEDPHAPEGGVSGAVLRTLRPVDWVTFGGVLIRREVIRACGSFDRRYQWAYVMDVDYSFEARLRGYRLFQVPVSLQHEENRTTRPLWEADPQLLDHVSRNYDLFYEKWGPFTAALTPCS